jgi:hypothetical protein
MIFRVQNGEGYGPYGANMKHTGITSDKWARDTDLYHNDKPCPREDGIDYYPGGWLCAFSELAELLDWFTHEEIAALDALGFDIWELDVSETHEDGTFAVTYGMQQMIFDPAEINHQELWKG